MQPQLIKGLIEKFGEEVANLFNNGTPGTLLDPSIKTRLTQQQDKV